MKYFIMFLSFSFSVSSLANLKLSESWKVGMIKEVNDKTQVVRIVDDEGKSYKVPTSDVIWGKSKKINAGSMIQFKAPTATVSR